MPETKDSTTYINDGFGRKSNNVWYFYDFPSFLKIFINIHEHANWIICIS